MCSTRLLAFTCAVFVSTAVLHPATDLATLPVVYWGGSTLPRPPSNIDMLSKLAYIVIEKWEGACWDACLKNLTSAHPRPCEAACAEEDHQLATLRAVRAASKNSSSGPALVFYLNAMLDFNFLSLHQRYVDADALLRNTDGTLCHLTNDAGMLNVTVFDFAQDAGRALWVDTARNLTATGVVDGIYADQAQVFAEKNAKTGAWGLCKKSHNTCCTLTEAKAEAYNAGKAQVLLQVAALLGPRGLLCAGGNTSTITSLVIHPTHTATKPHNLAKNIRKALETVAYVHVVHDLPTGDQKADARPPSDITSICTTNLVASFLLGVEPGAFLGCNGWDAANMGRPLGLPLGPMQGCGGGWDSGGGGQLLCRNFSSGTSVTWNVSSESGIIHWV